MYIFAPYLVVLFNIPPYDLTLGRDTPKWSEKLWVIVSLITQHVSFHIYVYFSMGGGEGGSQMQVISGNPPAWFQPHNCPSQ